MRVLIAALISLTVWCAQAKESDGNQVMQPDANEMVQAVSWIDKNTKLKNFEEATKFYFSGTRFYQYSNLEEGETSKSQSYTDAMSALQIMFKTRAIKLRESVKLDEEVKFNGQGQGAVRTVYKRTYEYQGTNTVANETYLRIFDIEDGKLVILEEHLL